MSLISFSSYFLTSKTHAKSQITDIITLWKVKISLKTKVNGK